MTTQGQGVRRFEAGVRFGRVARLERMADTIQCPKCAFEFEPSARLREHIEIELRTALKQEYDRRVAAAEAQSDARLREKDVELEVARGKVAEAAANEAALLRNARELEERERKSAVELERTLADETRRIREEAAKVAEERAARVVEQAVQEKQRELVEARAKVAAAAEREALLLGREREVTERERDAELELERKLAEESRRIREEEAKVADERATRRAEDRFRMKEQELDDAIRKAADTAREAEERASRRTAEQMRAKDTELDELKRRADETNARNLELAKQQRLLEERDAGRALEFERRMTEEVQRIRRQAEQTADERMQLERDKARLKEQEQQQTIDTLRRQIDEFQRSAHQGSQQAQGEAQEVILRDVLAEAFDDDLIEDVPKGVSGADLVQRVRGPDGREHGSIVWESKRTKAWSDGWLPKLRDDQRAVGASCAVLVSQALPAGVQQFELRDGVWVCGRPYARALAVALREALVEVSHARRAAEGRGEKMQMLYEYLTGAEFRNRVSGFVEAFREMEDDLAHEKRATLASWKRREKLLLRARNNIAAFYGDLQGIAGRQIADLPDLSLAAIGKLPSSAADDGESDGANGSSKAPTDSELAELLLSLVPADGTTVGNGALGQRFAERVLLDHGVSVGPREYETCRAVLLSEGRIRRGSGRGGSVARVRISPAS